MQQLSAGSPVERKEDPGLSPCESQVFASESSSGSYRAQVCRDRHRRAGKKQRGVVEVKDETLSRRAKIFFKYPNVKHF